MQLTWHGSQKLMLRFVWGLFGSGRNVDTMGVNNPVRPGTQVVASGVWRGCNRGSGSELGQRRSSMSVPELWLLSEPELWTLRFLTFGGESEAELPRL